jgi:cysteine sulfinate desulfinase/cysteine desulfurase-like protein
VLGVDAKAEAALEEARRKMEALIGAEAPARG